MKRILGWIRGSNRQSPQPAGAIANNQAIALSNQAIVKAQRASVEHPEGPPDYWEVGDRARLISGGPVMTVSAFREALSGTLVECTWFHGTKLKAKFFPLDAIESVD